MVKNISKDKWQNGGWVIFEANINYNQFLKI